MRSKTKSNFIGMSKIEFKKINHKITFPYVCQNIEQLKPSLHNGVVSLSKILKLGF